ncbi:STAS/SEC14 domain-containing protein [Thalassorhabdus alkalitolerans]|uniref:STAS/SEC14 domain-containing protein n=1 Tax=Thalassorhabdus alkalitolerans TaxID=2282697 RepID=A0ABW0YL30_9BACI
MNQKLEWSTENILAYEIDSKVTEDEYKELVDEVERKMDEYESIRIFVRVPDLEGADVSTLNDRVKFLKDNDLKQIEKYALVGDQKTLKAAAKGMDKLTGANVRSFDLEEEQEAKNWVVS